MPKKTKQVNYTRIIYILIAVIVIETIFLIASFQRREGVVVRKEEPKKKEEVKKAAQPAESKVYLGKIAIVLDDWGYNTYNVEALKEIKEPLTLAILPRQAYSAEIARVSAQLKKEAILHLPLEPRQEKNYRLEPDTILTAMSKREILEILDEDLESVPGARGISNHMGSLATENERLMKIILTELKKRGLYFLDSLTGKTVCKKLAASIGLPYARRHVFLDNKETIDYIKGQLEILAKIAMQEGSAIGIGHDRPKTLEVLVKSMPDLRKRGFKFVYVSELVK
jgi:polysaccharide deacetylase 2 family uncharacterized protein YibQ